MPPALLHGVLNVGSINEDRVYRVHSIARPGETVCGLEYRVFAGGKGANQSVALARAGARVRHVGKVGNGGAWLRDKLAGCGVGVRHVTVADAPTGHAVIQVDASGENSIVLFPGTNHQITADERRQALDGAAPGDWLLLQNEVNDIPDLMAMGRERGLRIVLNPAPMTTPVRAYPLELADLLILNETEGEALTGEGEPSRLLDALRRRLPAATIVLTLGAAGARVAERDGDASPVATPPCPGHRHHGRRRHLRRLLPGSADRGQDAGGGRALRLPRGGLVRHTPRCHGLDPAARRGGELDPSAPLTGRMRPTPARPRPPHLRTVPATAGRRPTPPCSRPPPWRLGPRP